MSARRREKLYRLSDGQAIITTVRTKLTRPEGVDGVLRISGARPAWLSHRALEEIEHQTAVPGGWKGVAEEIATSWNGRFNFHPERLGADGSVAAAGLRPPQVGSLHAVGAHWSLHQQPATIIMPTGTGKTETMLATLAAYAPVRMLVVVPSRVLRDQTARKFQTLGLLRSLGNLHPAARNPIVGIIRRQARTVADLDIFEKCNVLITTMSAIAEGTAKPLAPEIAKFTDVLIVDEAHHLGAAGWSAFRDHFAESRVLQYTATPYRRDGKLVDGKVIYDYPLRVAQEEGYFKRISFDPVFELDPENIDRAIASAAVAQLRKDIGTGLDHLMMVRCANIGRATAVHDIYEGIAPDLRPVVVHSDAGDNLSALDLLRSRESRIVVCVNMLGEGFDLPQLKVAAVHDAHKSLAVLLQFVGRFVRSAGATVGDATVIANIADPEVSSALERLYSEDADWNQLLSEYSSEATRAHAELVEFLNTSKRLDEEAGEDTVEISHHLLRPTLSSLVYDCPSFAPKKFFEGVSGNQVHRVWLHEASDTLYFVTRADPPVLWTRSHDLHDRQWDLFILHYDSGRHLLFLSSSDHSSLYEDLATAVGATRLISGDVIFRTLGRINRLIFQNVGVRKHGRRNLRFALYTGSDVAEALSISERAGSVKSNLSGMGWENGKPVTIGCSYKGRIWSREQGTVPEFVKWCGLIGEKLQDDSIDTRDIIANVLIPEEVDQVPDKNVLSLDWPLEILRQSEERISLHRSEEDLPISMFDINFTMLDGAASDVRFQISSTNEDIWASFVLHVGGPEGFTVKQTSADPVVIRVGSLRLPLAEYLSSYPPLVRFSDLSELDGNLLIRPQSTQELVFPAERFEAWDWEGVDVTKESIWKNHTQREDSIQWRAARQFIDGGFGLVFDDDASGEAADLICLKEEEERIRLALVHCKYTKGATSGERVKDVVEVCSQAVRSAKWKWRFRDLCHHIIGRERRLASAEGRTRFLSGHAGDLSRFLKASRFKEVQAEIIIIQPGLSRDAHTAEQTAILAATHSYLKETIGVNLDVVCGA